MTPPSLPRRLAAEFVATAALIVVGCGAAAVDAQGAGLGPIGIALAFGLIIMVMVASIGHVSGAHINPAVTIAFAASRHFPVREIGPYIAAQALGATAGSALLVYGLGLGLEAATTLPSGGTIQAWLCELVLTAILMFVITSVATDTRAVGELAAISIGATVAVGAIWGGPISGASMNPARSFGPALIGGLWQSHWIYWTAPILGALAGSTTYAYLRR